jgi:phosphoribosylanthranilate isomerase
MGKITVQLYEIQDPREAERLVELGVDHIGSVILSAEAWKVPALRDVVRLVRDSPAKSTLIPLLTRDDDILRALDYYQPDFVHFCETIPLAEPQRARREEICSELDRIQRRVKREFPPLGVIRSIPIPVPGAGSAAALEAAILAVAAALAGSTDLFMTDTLRGAGDGEAVQPVAGYVGITGEVCDWDLAKALVAGSPLPVLLAGGIGPENAGEGIAKVRPAGIDSCTQTNARDGRGRSIRFKKDFEKVRRLLEAVRQAEAAMGD